MNTQITITEYVLYDGSAILATFPEAEFRKAVAKSKTIASEKGHKLTLCKRTSQIQFVTLIHPVP